MSRWRWWYVRVIYHKEEVILTIGWKICWIWVRNNLFICSFNNSKTLFRYIAVCAPFFRLKYRIKARFYILPILLFAPLYNVPRFFEFKTTTNITYTCFKATTMTSEVSATRHIVLSYEEFNMLSNVEVTKMCLIWVKKHVVELVITDFRVNPIYISVSRFRSIIFISTPYPQIDDIKQSLT